MIERVTHAVDAINVLVVFCSCYTVISAVIVQLHYHVSDLVTNVCERVKD